MRNYRKGEVALTSFGHLYRLTEDVTCGMTWVPVESVPEGEPGMLREDTIVFMLEVQNEQA